MRRAWLLGTVTVKENSEKQRYELSRSLFLAEPSSRNKRGGGPSGLMRPFGWIITFLLFSSLSFSLHPLSLHPLLFFLPPLLLFSQTSSPPIRDPTRSSLIPANRRLYWLFTLVTSLPHRRWILVGAVSLSLKSNFARHRTPRGRTMWFTHRHRLNYRPSS